MRIVQPSFEVVWPESQEHAVRMMKLIERIGRIAYQSLDKVTDDSYIDFIRMVIGRGHESVIEHSQVSAIVVTDRGITHEIVRHRLVSYTQESTRYCNYSKGKFRDEITVIKPPQLPGDSGWTQAMLDAEDHYLWLLAAGASPQIARSVLPNSLKAQIGITANLREWRHIFKLRTSKAAHPQIQHIMGIGLQQMGDMFPGVFEDILS